MDKTQNFDNVLNECLERMLVRGEDLEKCLSDYPELADELRPLLDCARLTKSTANIEPQPDVHSRSRYQFQQAVHAACVKKQPRRWFVLKPAWVSAIASLLVVLSGSGATVAASSNAMPDSGLYGIKLASEQVRLTLTPSVAGKAEFNAELADKRVNEIIYLAGTGNARDIEVTTARLNENLNQIIILNGGTPLVADAQATGGTFGTMATREDTSMVTIASAPTESKAATTTPPMLAAAPPPTPAETPIPAAGVLPSTPSTAPAPRVGTTDKSNGNSGKDKTAGSANVKSNANAPKNNLQAAVAQSADVNTAKLREALANAPETAKAALLHAIEIAERGYSAANQVVNSDNR